MTEESTKTLIHAFVTSHLDYCNSLLYGIPQYQIDRLQRVQNAAARVTCSVPRFSHITPVLKHLHWLPVQFRIHFKIALLVFKALIGMAPPYLIELLQLKTAKVPRTRCKTLGDRAFVFATPKIWNNLPLAVRESETFGCFKT